MLKYREPPNGKSVIPIYNNNSSTMMTIPIRIAKKYKLYHSNITYEERGCPFKYKDKDLSNGQNQLWVDLDLLNLNTPRQLQRP